jgi:hypothetical protein
MFCFIVRLGHRSLESGIIILVLLFIEVNCLFPHPKRIKLGYIIPLTISNLLSDTSLHWFHTICHKNEIFPLTPTIANEFGIKTSSNVQVHCIYFNTGVHYCSSILFIHYTDTNIYNNHLFQHVRYMFWLHFSQFCGLILFGVVIKIDYILDSS